MTAPYPPAGPEPQQSDGAAPAAPDRMMSRRVAWLLDDLVPIPGTKGGLGIDAVLGLVPGIGDVLGSGLSGMILLDAVRARVPIPTLARMAWNLILDAGLGVVPVAGDVADVAHRANRKNYRLLLAAVERNPDPGPPSAGYLVAAVFLTVLPLVLTIALGILTLVLLLRWLL